MNYFKSDIAVRYGVKAAILAEYLWECMEEKSLQILLPIDEKVWVKCSARMMTSFFPYFSKDEVRYALQCLVEDKVLLKRKLHKSKFDHTNSYTFTEYGVQLMMKEGDA